MIPDDGLGPLPADAPPPLVPDAPGALPYDPGALPYDPGALPYEPGALPYAPGALPYAPGALPDDAARPTSGLESLTDGTPGCPGAFAGGRMEGVETPGTLTRGVLTGAGVTAAGVVIDGMLTVGLGTDGVVIDGMLTDGVGTDGVLTEGTVNALLVADAKARMPPGTNPSTTATSNLQHLRVGHLAAISAPSPPQLQPSFQPLLAFPHRPRSELAKAHNLTQMQPSPNRQSSI